MTMIQIDLVRNAARDSKRWGLQVRTTHIPSDTCCKATFAVTGTCIAPQLSFSALWTEEARNVEKAQG